MGLIGNEAKKVIIMQEGKTWLRQSEGLLRENLRKMPQGYQHNIDQQTVGKYRKLLERKQKLTNEPSCGKL